PSGRGDRADRGHRPHRHPSPRRALLLPRRDREGGRREFDGREIDEVRSEIGLVPVYELSFEGSPLALVHPGVGAPLAAGFLEELIARGVTRVIACGGAGVLVPESALGHVIVPTDASRDERTTHHDL